MPRPVSIDTEQILAAARAVFLEKGIRGTTAEVAQRAGIAEGSIFNHFKTKAELFGAAMQLTVEESWLRALSDSAGQGDLARNLYDAGLRGIDFLRQLLPAIMMSWSNRGPSELPELLSIPEPPPLRVLQSLAAYFGSEMRHGRLRKQDPDVAARLFLGALQNYAFFELILRAHGHATRARLSPEDYMRGVVDLFLHGAAGAATTAATTAPTIDAIPRTTRARSTRSRRDP
jgi:AcrR family transcriptional regulator